ncbi:hypothetical protein JGI13_02041, partial [Candidatus Kryptonium thompsonii]
MNKIFLAIMFLQISFFNWMGRKAPELEGGIGWINSKPLKLSELKGKVVLIDFFSISSSYFLISLLTLLI